MLKFFLNLIIICFIIFPLAAQEKERSGPFEKHNPNGYQMDGSAFLEDYGDSLNLRFTSNFNTKSGPDLDVYLSKNDDFDKGENVFIAPLKSNTGKQKYSIPDSIGFYSYDYVIVYCTNFSHEWGQAMLQQKTTGFKSYISENNILKAWKRNNLKSFQIFSSTGKIIYQSNEKTQLPPLKANKLYFVRYQLTNGHWQSEKIILTK